MFSTIKLYLFAGIGLLLIGSHTFAYFKGSSDQKDAEETKALKDGFDALKLSVEQATKVQEKMMQVSEGLVQKTAELRSNTVVIREAQRANARANPLPSSCTLDGTTIELRNQQIDQIWRALGLDLPAERQGKLPSG